MARRPGRLGRRTWVLLWALLCLFPGCARLAPGRTDPLPSWNDGAVKASIVEFVRGVTTAGRAEFAFALDRVRALAPRHPEWRSKQPFKAVLDGDLRALAASGQKGLVELLLATHTGMTTDEFAEIVAQWLATARHPRFHRAYTDLVYQPMLELLAYLRASGFKTYIVSGGTVEFMRVWADRSTVSRRSR